MERVEEGVNKRDVEMRMGRRLKGKEGKWGRKIGEGRGGKRGLEDSLRRRIGREGGEGGGWR